MEAQEGDPLIRPSTDQHPLYEPICDACRTVHDPEIPVNIGTPGPSAFRSPFLSS